MRAANNSLLFLLFLTVQHLCAQQQPPEAFRWIDFHAEEGPDRDIVVWVSRSLEAEKWTAIREIGVEYDAALVVTSLRATPQSPVDSDTYTVWNASLTNHGIAPLMKGVNLRWLDWMQFVAGQPMEPTALFDNCAECAADTYTVWNASLTNHGISPLMKGVNLRWLDWMHFVEGQLTEPAALFDNCAECAADTYFTAFHYDVPQHMWMGRWMRGAQAVPVWGARGPDGVTRSQVYARLTDATGTDSIGTDSIGTWSHYDYGMEKPPQDFFYRYYVDPFSHLERTDLLSGKAAAAMKDRLCRAQGVGTGLARGQDSVLCKPIAVVPVKAGRKPVTTPPANNRGQSQPPAARH